ncbi:MAG: TetR/AcrR family transcriptional regulator [Gammaproteobacteria bacterium SHHR-1]|uniref:TetR/AcrR family transcriptional regulator n=1 Tax=Magnetovirga frankeli TaxID=947516 RepID=UPI001293F97C|nr:TetR/AcrR family transcriptional regulator [gamma proteobacterium SS-5]
MTSHKDIPQEASERTETRRAQILEAASDCFRRKGFHAASIALIGKTAGMSPGHIYHYFENKEAIIAAIVAQDLERLLLLTEEMRNAEDVQQAMLQRVSQGVSDNLDPVTAALKLEIVAEAARNPDIAQIVCSADLACRVGLIETLRQARGHAGHADSEAQLAAKAEVLAALFEGLLIRSVRNPELDPEQLAQLFQRVVRDLMEG